MSINTKVFGNQASCEIMSGDAILFKNSISLDAEYAVNRINEYPSIQDLIVALAEKEEGDSTMWDEITTKRAEIKVKFPKQSQEEQEELKKQKEEELQRQKEAEELRAEKEEEALNNPE